MSKRPIMLFTYWHSYRRFHYRRKFTFEQATVNWRDRIKDVRAVDQNQSRFKKQTFEISRICLNG